MKPRQVSLIRHLVTACLLSVGYSAAKSCYVDEERSEKITCTEDRSFEGHSSKLCYGNDYQNFGSFQKDFEQLHDDEMGSPSLS